MSSYSDKLEKLLPSVYLDSRYTHEENVKALDALLQAIAEEVKVIESDIGQLYDNWFIETWQRMGSPVHCRYDRRCSDQACGREKS